MVTAQGDDNIFCANFFSSGEENKMMIFILVQATRMFIEGGKHVYTTKEEGLNNSQMPQAFVNNES